MRLHCYGVESCWAAWILRGRGELVEGSLAGRKESGDGGLAGGRQEVAVRLGDFTDQAVGAQQSQLTCHTGRLAVTLLIARRLAEQHSTHISVAKSGYVEFATRDGRQ